MQLRVLVQAELERVEACVADFLTSLGTTAAAEGAPVARIVIGWTAVAPERPEALGKGREWRR